NDDGDERNRQASADVEHTPASFSMAPLDARTMSTEQWPRSHRRLIEGTYVGGVGERLLDGTSPAVAIRRPSTPSGCSIYPPLHPPLVMPGVLGAGVPSPCWGPQPQPTVHL